MAQANESYTTNQWYNLENGVTGPGNHNSFTRTTDDNPRFMFPGSVVPGAQDRRRNIGLDGDQRLFSPNASKIQRGFMRCLLNEVPTSAAKGLPNRRFFFQFNPERIMRSVSLSSGMTNILFQDPGQFSVATPGNATFSFDIMLNREMEVNNHKKNYRDRPADKNVGKPPGPQDVGQIGVLADLMVMDSVIGQGISEDIISALSKITSVSSTWEPADSSSGASGNTNYISEQVASDAFKSIKGNSAFLVSTPVRIVFSAMFMVDGFIQSSSVNFTKFSTQMVPTMCTINVTVEAKYIGFAQKDTYLTQALGKIKSAPPTSGGGGGGGDTLPEDKKGADYDVLVKAVKDSGMYQIALGGTSDSDHPAFDELIKTAYFGDPDEHKSYNPVGQWKGYKDVWEILHYGTFLLVAGFVTLKSGPRDAPVYKGISKLFFERQYDVKIEHTPKVKIWRQFVGTEKEFANADPEKKTTSGQKIGPGTKKYSVSRDVLLLNVEGEKATATTFEEWKKWARYGSDDTNKIPSHDNRPNNVFKDSGASDLFANKLYLEGSNADNWKTTKILMDFEVHFSATISKPGSSDKSTFSKIIKFYTETTADNICHRHFNFNAI